MPEVSDLASYSTNPEDNQVFIFAVAVLIASYLIMSPTLSISLLPAR
jgi:hypothetical protein